MIFEMQILPFYLVGQKSSHGVHALLTSTLLIIYGINLSDGEIMGAASCQLANIDPGSAGGMGVLISERS